MKEGSQWPVTIGVDVMWVDVGVQLVRSRHAMHMGSPSAIAVVRHTFSAQLPSDQKIRCMGFK